MFQALQEAKKALEKGEVPIGAVVVSNDKIISRSHNLTQTLNDVTAHAEMLAITSAENFLGGKYLDDCTLYVTLEPCAMCAGAIGWAQIKRLVIGAKDDKKGYHLFAPKSLHPKCEVLFGVLDDESSSLLKEFFRLKRI